MARVLVVDDSDVIAHLLVTVLRDHGHDPVEVSEDSKRLLDPTDPLWDGVEFLVTDLRMPGVSGMRVIS